jgi:putative ABC transport system permease protein
MLKNYFKIAWRNLFREKTLAFVNVLGLSMGIACFILLLLYVVNELSFDRFHKNEKDTYFVYEWKKGKDGNSEYSASMAMPLGPTLKKDFPDVINYVRIKQAWDESFVRIGNEVLREKVSFADPQFFSVFSFPLKYGNSSLALTALNGMVLTASKAKELFGNENVIGRTIQIKVDKGFQPFVISGVAEDMPANSSIQFDLLANFAYLETTEFGKLFNNWYTTAFRTYIQLRPGSHLPDEAQRLLAFHRAHNEDEGTITKATTSLTTYGLMPLRSIHINTRINDIAFVENIHPKTIWIISGIALAILIIACINFTTLAIGRSAGRSREVGVRKVIGAARRQIIFQFLSESFLLSILSTLIGLFLVQILMPYFNKVSGRELQFSFARYPELSWLLIGLILVVSLLAGSYPSLLLSKFKPIEVLKNRIRLGGSNFLTHSLVSLQFSLSLFLLVSTIVILRQTKYMKDKNPGFNKENVLIVDAAETNANKIYPILKQELQTHADVRGIAASESGFGEGLHIQGHGFMHYGVRKIVYEYGIDENYLDVLGMQLAAGRNFNPTISDDTVTSVIINEAMMVDFGWTLQNVIGQQIKGYTNTKTPVVVGVVKNFNFQSLSEKIQPQLFHRFPNHQLQKIFVRIKPGSPAPVIAALQKAWTKIASDFNFKYSFLDEDLGYYYRSEQRWSKIIGWAGGVSIFLACLGLFGLVTLAAVNRVKEISIRKVLGASFAGIITLLSKDFLKIIIVALLIASPFAWYAMNRWLQSFAYRIEIGWTVFAIAGLIVLFVSMIAIGYMAIKAALANPVKSLRTE